MSRSSVLAARRQKLEWYDREVMRVTGAHVTSGMKKAVELVASDARQRVNRGQPTRRSKSGRRYGLDPSKEGEPPKVVSSMLKKSIRGRVKRMRNLVRGAIGSALVYARRLELGFVGVDTAGRTINQGPRPYLRPSVIENKKLILRTIARG
jgi:hypothetical protein